MRMMFGIDSVHGAIYVKGATVFPQQINAGASFNRDLAQRMGQVTAKDTRAAGASQPPCFSSLSVLPHEPTPISWFCCSRALCLSAAALSHRSRPLHSSHAACGAVRRARAA